MSFQASSALFSETWNEEFDNIIADTNLRDLYTSSPPGVSVSSSTLDDSSLPSTDLVRRPRTCWVYKHMPDPNPETKYYSQISNKLEWRCRYCPKRYSLNGGTRCIMSHLNATHDINQRSPREERAKKRQLSIEDALTSGLSNPQKRRRLQCSELEDSSLNPDQLEILYIDLITSCNLPLRLVECPAFRDLLYYLNKDIDTWLPDSHNSVHSWLLRQFGFQKEQVKSRLHSSRTAIHLALDLWSSPNCLPILGVVAHYISEDNSLEESVLSVQVIEGDHSGENLARYTMKTIDDYGIASKLGWLQMDSAPSNDTLIRELSIGISLIPVSQRAHLT